YPACAPVIEPNQSLASYLPLVFPFSTATPILVAEIGLRAVGGGMDRLMRAAVRGTGCSVPARVVPNEEFTETIDTSDEWIRSRTGIRERRFAGVADTAATLGTEAARNALNVAGADAQDVDLIVCATVTPDLMCPSTACLIQAYLGCRTIPSFDVS